MDIKKTLIHSFWICRKDLTEFSRSRLRLAMLIIMPLFMMMMVGFIFPSGNSLSDLPVAIVNLDDGLGNVSFGATFMQQLEMVNDQTGMMIMHNATGLEDIKDQIKSGDVNGGLLISENFTVDLLAGRQGLITVITDQSNPQVSSMMQSVLSETIKQMGSQLAAYNLNQTYHVSMDATTAMLQPYDVGFEGTAPGGSNYFQFVAPGIMAMVVMMSLMTGLPHAISYEKDMGTLDGMLVAPTSRWSIISGKVLAQTTTGIIQGIIILLMAILLFGVVVYGNILLVFFLILLTVFSFVGLGILITSFTDKEQTATMIMMTLMFPMMFLSGVFFPVQQMPWYMQDVAHFLPLTYAADAMRKVMVLGADVSAIMPEIIILAVFGIILLGIAVPMFKKAMSR